MNDQIGLSDMTQGNLTSFTTDRFGCPYSALDLNGGWTQVPSDVYFNDLEFTISVWIFPRQIGVWARIFDFGNNQLDNIFFAISGANTLQPAFNIISLSTQVILLVSPQKLVLNKWTFLTVTFNNTIIRLYLDGKLTIEQSHSFSLPSLKRTTCFIGQSNWATDDYSFSILDDLRFYSKCLTQAELIELMNRNQTSS